MRKVLLTLVALTGSIALLKGQPKVVMSDAFEKPSSGWNKIIQLKNGNTFYLHFTKKDGIDVTVYSKDRRVISEKNLTSELWDPRSMKESVIEGLYEINGQPVIFLEQFPGRTPTLYRLRLDANTGDLSGEKKLGELPRGSIFAGSKLTHEEVSEFHIEKDPSSDNYAVAFFNGRSNDADNRIQIVHYNGENKEINRAFYTAPNDKFKYLRYIGMTVDKDKQVFVCAYGSNNFSGGEDSRVILSKLEKGNKEFKHNILEFTEDFKNTSGQMLYNPGSNMLELLSLTTVKNKHNVLTSRTTSYYAVLLTFFDPSSLSTITSKVANAEKVDDYMVNKLGRSKGFAGMPQEMVINNDNTTTVLMEEMEVQERTNGHGMVTDIKTILKNIGISEVDETGHEKDGYAILKTQYAQGVFPNLYLAKKGKGLWHYESGGLFTTNYNAFLSFDYVNSPKGKYIIFNDLPKNIDKYEDEKRSGVFNPANTSTIYYQLNKGVMDKHYLFSNGSDDGPNYYSYIESSDYARENNTYAIIVVERDGKDKQARIAWVTFP